MQKAQSFYKVLRLCFSLCLYGKGYGNSFFIYLSPMKYIPLLLFAFFACSGKAKQDSASSTASITPKKIDAQHLTFDSTYKTIHVFVALCDNKYQGIVPVPAKIGNGQDPDNNLYWGCGYGIRSYFKNSPQWKLIKRFPIDSIRMERLVFKSNNSAYYLVADAWNGKYIRDCTNAFFQSCAGQVKDTLKVNNVTLGLNGHAKLVAYIGHDGLMNFRLPDEYKNTDGKKRDAIMLACYSKRFFGPLLMATEATPLVWSTGLMAPEAYVLHDALEIYIKNQPAENIRNAAAKAYSKYQKCSEKAARNLLVTGY